MRKCILCVDSTVRYGRGVEGSSVRLGECTERTAVSARGHGSSDGEDATAGSAATTAQGRRRRGKRVEEVGSVEPKILE